MLAAEADRRVPAILDGIAAAVGSDGPATETLEAIRIDAHGLKGAALVVGQQRLGDLAALMERRLADRIEAGPIKEEEAELIAGAAAALRDAAHAAANGEPEPPQLEASIAALRR